MVENKESRWSPGLVWSFCDEGKAREYMRIIVVFNSSSFKKKTKKKTRKRDFCRHISLDRNCIRQKYNKDINFYFNQILFRNLSSSSLAISPTAGQTELNPHLRVIVIFRLSNSSKSYPGQLNEKSDVLWTIK